VTQSERDEPSIKVREKIILEVMNGAEDGRLVVCEESPVSIGRASDNTVCLPYDHLISRHHAQVVKSGANFILRDLSSTNGTFVGRERVLKETPVKPNMLFRVGATLLRIKSSSSGEPPREPAEPSE
jgi:pSer/pThr/pTyr-binding forkhead associated (FHA) protein